VFVSLAEFSRGHPLVSAMPGWGMVVFISRHCNCPKRIVPPVAGFRTDALVCSATPSPQRWVLLLTKYPNVLTVVIRQHNKLCDVLTTQCQKWITAAFNIFISIYYEHTLLDIIYILLGNDIYISVLTMKITFSNFNFRLNIFHFLYRYIYNIWVRYPSTFRYCKNRVFFFNW